MDSVKRPFWAWVFCESDGTPSFSRVATAVLVAFACGWITAVVRYSHSLPELAGIGGFITVLYGANRIAAILQSKKD